MNKAGKWGENKACEYLQNIGYTVLHRNFRCVIDGKVAGEIDIIARDEKTIVFVEVKTRKTTVFGSGAEAVNFYKQEKLRKAARLFDPEEAYICRFDVIDILYAEQGNKELDVVSLRHFPNAF